MMASRSATSMASSWSWVTSTVVTWQGVVQVAQPLAQLGAHLGVERAEGLVEQQHLGLDGQRPGQGHALALAARELRGVAVAQVRQADQLEQLVHPRRDLGLGAAADLEPEGHVAPHRQVAEGRVVLEAEADAAAAGRRGGQVLALDAHGPGVGRVEPGDDAQQGGLAAAARAEQRGERAGGTSSDTSSRATASPNLFEIDSTWMLTRPPSRARRPGCGRSR